MNRSLVICKSTHHGNTRAVAERIAERLGAKVAEPEEQPPIPTQLPLLLGIGSGIYYGRFHRSIRRWLSQLPPAAGVGRFAFIYSTSGLPFLTRLYHWPLRRALNRRGFQIVGEFGCRGFDTFGPLWFVGGLHRRHPDARDLRRAEAFAEELDTQLPPVANDGPPAEQRSISA